MFRSTLSALALASVLTVCQVHAQAEHNPNMDLCPTEARQPADPFNPANIAVWGISLTQYVQAGGDTTYEMKGRLAAYVAAMELELEKLRKSAESLMVKAPKLKEVFRKNHATFLAYMDTQATLSEEARWWNLSNGTRDDGTARSYEFLGVKAALLWKQMRSYAQFIGTEKLEMLVRTPMVVPDSDTVIGGHESDMWVR